MSADASLNELVEAIVARVQARLIPGAHPGPIPTSACAGVGAACDTCRGCHVHRAADVRKVVQLGAERISAGAGNPAPAADLAPFIDHTLLKADATREELKKLCDEAKRYGFATVCVNAANVRFCAAQLDGSTVKPIAVVGFPLGAGTPSAKAFETREAVRNGAQEIDMVINLGALKSGEYAIVLDDIQAVVTAAAPKPVKVILETGALDHDQKVVGCALSKVAGAAFVKTSTGFGPGGATAEDVALMRRIVGPGMGVKASGGVRTTEDARAMVEAGATRIGASASVGIVSGTPQTKGKVARGYS
jgi:deoxyribose-phosphate aldolase